MAEDGIWGNGSGRTREEQRLVTERSVSEAREESFRRENVAPTPLSPAPGQIVREGSPRPRWQQRQGWSQTEGQAVAQGDTGAQAA